MSKSIGCSDSRPSYSSAAQPGGSIPLCRRCKRCGSEHLQRRIDTLSKPIQDIGWKAQVRLCRRFRRLVARGKHPNVVVTAIARELIAFMWAIAKEVPITTYASPTRSRVAVGVRPRFSAQPSCTLRGGSGRSSSLDRGRRVDGSQSGGTQPTDLSTINRRCDWPRLGADPGVFTKKRARRCDRCFQHLGAVDIRSHINVAASAAAAHDRAGRRRLQADVGRPVTSVPALYSQLGGESPP